ncbi:MAG: hypothetical protein Tsb0020_10630 [Haliangiales bacterium]
MSAPALTIIYHPVLSRIGERIILGQLIDSGRAAKISRDTSFQVPDSTYPGTPLNEPHVSRKPCLLSRTHDGSLLLRRDQCRSALVANGTAVTDDYPISKAQLARGVILELADHVALLLHEHRAISEDGTGDLGLVGHSGAIVEVRQNIRRVAPHDSMSVLIRGETGTGKEPVAQAIHAASNRRRKEMYSVNLTTHPGSMAATALFGSIKGAYTGATAQPGYFRAADGSTLFLDEIGELKDDVQVMLLRVLETKQVTALGSQRDEQVDVRVIAATDADLEAKSERGEFRAPLLHRLSQYVIDIPPLRQRRDDIARLMMHFLGIELRQHDQADLLRQRVPQPWLPMDIVVQMVRYDWTGNVRELKNFVATLVVNNLDKSSASLSPHWQKRLDRERQSPAPSAAAAASATTSNAPGRAAPATPPLTRRALARKPLDELTGDDIIAALESNDYELRRAARQLGISHNTLAKLRAELTSLRAVKDISDDEIQTCGDRHHGDISTMAAKLGVSRRALLKRLKKMGIKR